MKMKCTVCAGMSAESTRACVRFFSCSGPSNLPGRNSAVITFSHRIFHRHPQVQYSIVSMSNFESFASNLLQPNLFCGCSRLWTPSRLFDLTTLTLKVILQPTASSKENSIRIGCVAQAQQTLGRTASKKVRSQLHVRLRGAESLE